jgi:peptide/nickel transport system ATP-binding protein
VLPSAGMSALLSVENLTTVFKTDGQQLVAVAEVSFCVPAGRTLALVGESGCGKSVTALSILQLLPSPPGFITGGRILLAGEDLLTLSERQLRAVRGRRVAMIFQEPMTSLNPVFCVGAQIVEAVRLHQDLSRQQARARAIELLGLVGIPSPEERFDAYPHQLSGGMRQRVMIAMALSCNPELLIADEPTTALDVTIQAQILELLAGLQHKLGMSILFITHDLGIVAEFAHEVAVMYAGRIVEQAPVAELFASPRHPYTRGLLASIPPFGPSHETAGLAPSQARPRSGPAGDRLTTIEGMVPDLRALPPGCRFAPRCSRRAALGEAALRCEQTEPELSTLSVGRAVRCHFSEEGQS